MGGVAGDIRVALVLIAMSAAALGAVPEGLGRASAAKLNKLDGNPVLFSRASIEVDPELERRYADVFSGLRQVVPTPVGQSSARISVRVVRDWQSLPPRESAALKQPESFWLHVEQDRAVVVGGDMAGAIHGTSVLAKLLAQNQGNVRAGDIIEWPDHRIRALHVVLRRVNLTTLIRLVRLARQAQLNTLVLQLADGVMLKSLPGLARADALTHIQIKEFLNVARQNGIEVVPELKLLTHQEKLFSDKHRSLMYNRTTYDPANMAVYRIVSAVIDEVIDLFRPRAIHIGHDEVDGLKPGSRRRNLGEGEEPLPPERFLDDVNRLHALLRSRGVETWMWGDMLLLHTEFPSMHNANMNGFSGYAQLRDRLPRDIIICDWHYFGTQDEFPTSKKFTELGYRVLGATWKRPETIKNFSRYVADLPNGGDGMIATTWFHVQRGEWEIVERIINISGEAFWNAR